MNNIRSIIQNDDRSPARRESEMRVEVDLDMCESNAVCVGLCPKIALTLRDE